MGNREECPACHAYSSDIYAAVHFDQSDCPKCGCPYDLLVKWSQMKPSLEILRESKVKEETIKIIEDLQQENAKLKTKIHKMYEILAWRDIEELFEPILKVKLILESSDE